MKTKLYFLILFFGIIFNINAQIPTDSLVGYWPFNGNANDESNNSNNGSIYGATLTTDRFGSPNSAYIFDGINDWIVIGNDESLNFNANDAYTVSVWVKVDSNHVRGDILGKWENSYDPYPYRLQCDVLYGNYFYSRYIGSTTQDSTRQQVAKHYIDFDTNFHLLTAIYSPNSIELYFDSLHVQTSTNYMLSYDVENSYDIFIGKRQGRDDRYFKGIIDDIRIYQRTLSASEVKALYMEGITTNLNLLDKTQQFNIYPNPAKDYIYIQTDEKYKQSDSYSINLISITGNIIYKSKINQQLFKIDINDIKQTGLFFIQILDASNQLVYVQKLILN